jgi:hypothetical protein
MIGRRRQSDPSNPSKADKADAKSAKREAAVGRIVERSLRDAKVQEHSAGGGTLLTEPILVFVKWPRDQELRVFDQNCQQLGVARWSRDKAAKVERYGIYAMDDEAPLVAITWRTPNWLFERAAADCRVSDSEGIEIATVPARWASGLVLPIMVGAERIGRLKPEGWKKPGRVEDSEGREVARIHSSLCDVVEIEPSLAGPLRTVAVFATIIMGIAGKSSGGGGG